MKPFGKSNTKRWWNVFCMVGLAAVETAFIFAYKESLRKEKEEARYVSAQAFVKSMTAWEKVTRRNGVVTQREPYYEVDYLYIVGSQIHSGHAKTKFLPGEQLTIYYDPQDPSTSVAEPTSSKKDFNVMVGVGVFAGIFIAVNAISFYRKSKSARRIGTDIGRFALKEDGNG